MNPKVKRKGGSMIMRREVSIILAHFLKGSLSDEEVKKKIEVASRAIDWYGKPDFAIEELAENLDEKLRCLKEGDQKTWAEYFYWFWPNQCHELYELSPFRESIVKHIGYGLGFIRMERHYPHDCSKLQMVKMVEAIKEKDWFVDDNDSYFVVVGYGIEVFWIRNPWVSCICSDGIIRNLNKPRVKSDWDAMKDPERGDKYCL